MEQKKEPHHHSLPPNLLLWLSIASLFFILIISFSLAFFLYRGDIPSYSVKPTIEEKNDWSLRERVEAACASGRIPSWRCKRPKSN